MKILIPGDKEKAKRRFEAPKVFTCYVCGCAFEATKDEYKFEDACTCPTCHHNVMHYE